MEYDFLIIGQGIAGSVMAIELLRQGKRVMVVDRQDTGSSSRVAAGLITPITGKGMNPAWRQNEYLTIAAEFYRSLEEELGVHCYHETEVIRLFSSEQEREKWRRKGEEYHRWGQEFRVDEKGVRSKFGGILMNGGAWLDTKVFLQATQTYLEKEGAFCVADFDDADVMIHSDGIRWRGVRASKLLLCQGAYGLGHGRWFGDISHRSAKGEILTLQVPELSNEVRYHADGWLAGRGDGTWKAGASYDWIKLNSKPTDQGRDEIIAKISSWFDLPMEVVGHEAGVRPIIRNSRPVVGLHPECEQIGFFNGLGSKGALMAPAVGRHFAAFLVGKCQLDSELAIPFPKFSSVEPTVTNNLLKEAHALAEEVIQPGDVVIDATLGNGHDTLFLASLVGKEGRVIGFDVQEQAIESTRKKVNDSMVDLESVILHHVSHEKMGAHVKDKWHGKVACIIFNLGYLPGADKALITQVDSTLDALFQACTLLRAGGVLSVMCYPGHSGGDTESVAVTEWMQELPKDQFRTQRYVREGARSSTPFLWVASKK